MKDTQSNKVLATLSIIDALKFDEDDLSDLTGYLAKQCGFDFSVPIRPEKWTDKRSPLEGKTMQEILEKSMEELEGIEAVQLAIPPVDVYNLVAIVQAAIVCLDLPQHSKETGRQFVYGFCDRYRDQMPTIVKAIEGAWENPNLMTEDEFEETLGEKWQRIAREVEQEMGGEVKIIVDKPHQGALCPVNGEPCSKGGNFYYYPGDCPAYAMCEDVASSLEYTENCDR